MRLDLAPQLSHLLLRDVFARMTAGGANQAVGVIFDEGSPVTDPLPGRLERIAAAGGCTLLEVLRVSGDQWWPVLHPSDGACAPRTLPAAPSAVVAEATVAGLVALPSRESMAELLAPAPAHQLERMRPLIAAAENEAVQAILDGHTGRAARSVKRAMFAACRERESAPGAATERDDASATRTSALPGAMVARFGVALTTTALRDAVWLAVDDGRLTGRALWQELATRLPAPYSATPLLLFGWRSWRDGNGALARISADAALRSDQECHAADLLLAALDRGLDPRTLPRLRSSGRR